MREGPPVKNYETVPLMDGEDVFAKDKFHDKSWRCILNQARAVDTLQGFASLELTVVGARQLISSQAGLMTKQSPCNPFVTVLVDDDDMDASDVKRSTNFPQWDWATHVEIMTATSMVRLEVRDGSGSKDDPLVGFVEFCMGDLPWQKEVAGFLELQSPENFQRTSRWRYRRHISCREDQREAERRGDGTTRNGNGLFACGGCTKPHQTRRQEMGALNAGEIQVKLRLVRAPLVTWWDTKLALALNPPAPKDFGIVVMDNDAAHIDVQHAYDAVMDLKLHLLDEGLRCVMNFVLHLLKWRRTPLSVVVFAALCAPCFGGRTLIMTVAPGLLAFFLLICSCDWLRQEMCIGGHLAALDQHGFEQVAAWQDAKNMVGFVHRIIEHDLNGEVLDEHKLASFASRCFRDGVPLISFAKLREILKNQKWVTFEEVNYKEGDPVLIDGLYRALVTKAETNGKVTVVYEDHATADPQVPKPVQVDEPRVCPRKKIPNIPEFMIPAQVRSQMRANLALVDQIAAVTPTLYFIGDVISWRRKGIALIVLLSLSFISALTACAIFFKGEYWAAWCVYMGLKYLDDFTIGICVLIVFVTHCKWLVGLRACSSIISKQCKLRRSAPGKWAFYRSADASP